MDSDYDDTDDDYPDDDKNIKIPAVSHVAAVLKAAVPKTDIAVAIVQLFNVNLYTKSFLETPNLKFTDILKTVEQNGLSESQLYDIIHAMDHSWLINSTIIKIFRSILSASANIQITEKILHIASRRNDILTSILKKTDISPTIDCLYQAIESNDLAAIKTLLNHKLFITKECFDHARSPEIGEFLIDSYGFSLDLYEILYKNNVLINLVKYNTPNDDRIYQIWHKYKYVVGAPKIKFNIPTKILKFRTKFALYDLKKLQDIVKTTKLTPDYFCLNNAMDRKYYSSETMEEIKQVVAWLLKDYNLKPNVVSFIRIKNPTLQMHCYEYFKEYIENV